jgi:hypothetical protein
MLARLALVALGLVVAGCGFFEAERPTLGIANGTTLRSPALGPPPGPGVPGDCQP